MTRPPAALIDLIAGRELVVPIDANLVEAAIEHRVHGLLKSWVDKTVVRAELEPMKSLEAADVSSWARNQMLKQTTLEIFDVAHALQIDLAVIKGLSIELRWYNRLGERPSWDIDLLLPPWHESRADELIAALQPEHSLLRTLPEALRTRTLQSIDLGFKGIPVDLHLDPLKLEIASTKFPEALWEGSEWIDVEGAGHIRVLAPEATYLLAGLHLNKDRFRYLLGYADMLRIANTTGLDRDKVVALARAEGIGTSWEATEQVVRRDLGLSLVGTQTRPTLIWSSFWPSRTRLLGSEGKVRFRYRQFLIPAFDPRRWPELIAGWSRRVFPTGSSLDRIYPETHGPYWLRLIVGRFKVRVRRRRQRKKALSP